MCAPNRLSPQDLARLARALGADLKIQPMPELPEVESLTPNPAPLARSAASSSARESARSRCAAASADFAAQITRPQNREHRAPRKISDRRSDGDHIILVHLGMSGSLTHRRPGFDGADFDPRHDHLEFSLDDDTRLVYNDPRRFGMVRLIARDALAAIAELQRNRPRAVLRSLQRRNIYADKARGRRAAIKNLIMDQRIVAGRREYLRLRDSVSRARAPDPPRRHGHRAPSWKKSSAVHARGPARRDRQPRHHLSQLSRLARTPRPLRHDACRSTAARANAAISARRRLRNVVVGQRASFYCPMCQMLARRGDLSMSKTILAARDSPRCFAMPLACCATSSLARRRTPRRIDWKRSTPRRSATFAVYLRFDTTNPPDNTAAAIAFMKSDPRQGRNRQPRPSSAAAA